MKKRVKAEDQCWCCDGKGKVFDTQRRRSTMCEECQGVGIDPDKQHLYDDQEEE